LKAKNEATTVPFINEKIRFDKMQVISHEGKNLGVLTRDEALRVARQAELDLVILTDSGAEGVPIAKVMDFGKAIYAKKKQHAEAKKKQKVIQIKELKLRPNIGEHDYQTKINQAIHFLNAGKHVKFTLVFHGREKGMREKRGEELYAKIDQSLHNAGLTKLVQEKDTKTAQLWSRVYYLKK
jgi:translation initiation factor IF-3